MTSFRGLANFVYPPTQYKSKSDPPSIYHIITSFEILGKIFYNVRCVKNNSLILMLIYSLSFHFHLLLNFLRSKSNKMIINVYAKHELAHSFSRVEFQKQPSWTFVLFYFYFLLKESDILRYILTNLQVRYETSCSAGPMSTVFSSGCRVQSLIKENYNKFLKKNLEFGATKLSSNSYSIKFNYFISLIV